MSKLKLIACIDSTGGLGYKNSLLFDIKEDLKRFQDLTKGSIIVMGMRTFESIIERNSKPLGNGRTNVVLTRNRKYIPRFNEIVIHDIDTIFNGIKTMNENDKDVWVIGGGVLYRQLLPFCDEVYLTIVDKEAEQVDCYYPLGYQKELGFIPVEEEEYYSDKYDCSYTFTRYAKPDTPAEEE